ncbi:MAG TPA: pilus assembly protein TadG-related protein [Gaiellaceae bacterium]|nr:pilus assembly protein TadG-related protein [Gaiellaceae bacterium]
MRVNGLHSVGHSVASDRGAVLPWFALWLPVLVLFLVFVVDVGNWFEHKRHLQLQADAGALAGGGVFTIPCSDATIEAAARKYAGDPNAAAPYNIQVPPTNSSNVHVLINSTQYWNQGGTDNSDGGGPCETKMVDVKITEADLPLFFGIPGLFTSVPAINAHARVQIQELSFLGGGALPIAVPDVDPSLAKATFVDEETGAVLATTPLTNTGAANGLSIWDNTAAPVSVPISTSKIGVRIALSGNAASTACGDPLVDCYDTASANGIDYIRGWSSAGSGAQPNQPLARDVRLIPGTCQDPYFSSATATCTIGVSAVVDFGGLPPADTAVNATVDGTTRQLTYDAGTGRWISSGANFFAIAPAAGPVNVTLGWVERAGTVSGLGTCTTTGANPCKGTFGVVQRAFSADETRSGPIKLAQVWENGLFWANSFERGTTKQLVVKIGLTPNLQNAKDVNDPVVTLRVVGGSRNQSLDCDPNYSNLYEELAFGCRPGYTTNAGTPCPATAPTLWSTPQPWNCVAIQTGSATNQVPRGLNLRILGNEKPATCSSPNNWSQFPNIPAGDPRVLNVFITPFGSFGGSGSGVVPVVKLGTFYVTGWTASGSGFKNPCEGNGDDPVPGGDAGNIVGHFIKYVFGLNNGGGSTQTCNFDSFGSCIAVLTE